MSVSNYIDWGAPTAPSHMFPGIKMKGAHIFWLLNSFQSTNIVVLVPL